MQSRLAGGPAANLSFTVAPAAGSSANSAFYILTTNAQADAHGKCTLKLIPQVPYIFSWSGENEKNRDYSDGTALVTANADGKEPLTFVARQYLNALFLKFQNSKGQPISDVSLQISSWDVLASDQRNNMYNLKSGKDGTIQFNRLAKGTLQFQAYAGSGNYRQSHFAVSTDDVEATCVMHHQDEPATFSVLVLDAQGQPMPKTNLTLLTNRQGKISQQEHATGQDGIFKVPAGSAPSENARTLLCKKTRCGVSEPCRSRRMAALSYG